VKRVWAFASGGILGVLFCLSVTAVASRFGLLPVFPAYGGEEDFAFRFAVFLGFVVPGFVLLGGVIGISALSGRSLGRSIGGALLGTGLTLLLARLLSGPIASLATRRASNAAAAIFLLTWLVLSALGARLTHHRHSASQR